MFQLDDWTVFGRHAARFAERSEVCIQPSAILMAVLTACQLVYHAAYQVKVRFLEFAMSMQVGQGCRETAQAGAAEAAGQQSHL